jgi:GNAT superfamily N-acetyltransferase
VENLQDSLDELIDSMIIEGATMISLSPDDIVIEKLQEEDNISSFDSGDEEINDFIQNDSLKQMQAKMNVTYLCKTKDKTLIGFLTISSDSITINNADKKRLGIGYPAYPAIKIGRLGTHRDLQRLGIGSYMIQWVIGFAFEQCTKVGVRFISVDAYDTEEVQKFYRKNQFIRLNKSVDGNIPMYLDIDSWG